MKSVIKKRGKIASVRIPAAALQAAHLSIDNPVTVREEAGRIVFEPIQSKKFDLATLIRGITQKKLHRQPDFGRPVGIEVL